jgi:hypothetical protein
MLYKLPNGEYVPVESLMWGKGKNGGVWGHVPGGDHDDVSLDGEDAETMLHWLDGHSIHIAEWKPEDVASVEEDVKQ